MRSNSSSISSARASPKSTNTAKNNHVLHTCSRTPFSETAREVFPQAAHPVSFVERVMGRLGHEGHFHENCSALGRVWSFQSQYRPSTPYKYHYSIAASRCCASASA